MNNMNVIIADDHPIVLFGIRKSLEQIEMIDSSGKWRLMYLIRVIPSPYLSPGIDKSVIRTWPNT
jgi:hypothetical protein